MSSRSKLYLNRRKTCIVAAALAAASTIAKADTANWLTAVSGNWTDSTQWSTNPYYPNNNAPAGVSYSAIVDKPSASAYSINLATNLELSALTVASQNAIVQQTSGVLLLDGALDIQAGSYKLVSGTIKGGRIQTENGGTFSEVNTNGFVGTLDGVTLGSSIQVTNPNPFYLKTSFVLDNSAVTLSSATLFTNGSVNITGTGQFFLDANGANNNSADHLFALNGYTGGIISLGPGINIATRTGDGYLGWDSNLTIQNSGTITATSGRTITIGTIHNTGTINVNGGTVIFAGMQSPSDFGNIARTSGTVQLLGTLDNTGGTFDPATVGGTFVLGSGTINGGTLTCSNPTSLSIATQGTLRGVTLGSNLDLSSTAGTLSLYDGFNLNGHTFTTGSNVGLSAETGSINGPGTIVAANSLNGTINSGITVDCPVGLHFSGTNNGTFLVHNPTYPVYFASTNNGVINVSNNGALYLIGQTSVAQFGQINRDAVAPGTVRFQTGTLALSNSTFDLAQTGPLEVSGSGFRGGTLSSSSGAGVTVVYDWLQLDAMTVNAPITVKPGVYVNVTNNLTLNSTIKLQGSNSTSSLTMLTTPSTNSVISGNGIIAFEGPDQNASVRGSGTTISSGITVTTTAGGCGALQGASNSLINFLGTAAPGTNGTLAFNYVNNVGMIDAPPMTIVNFFTIHNGGSVSSTGGVINLGGLTTIPAIGTINNAGGTINITGLLENTGTTFATNPNESPWGLTAGGIISNGTIASPLNVTGNGTNGNAGGFLTSTTLSDTTVTVQPGGFLTINTGITLNNSRIDLLNSVTNSGAASTLSLPSGTTISGTGSIQFDGAGSTVSIGGSFTLPAGISMVANTAGATVGLGASNSLMNNGVISAQAAGQSLSILPASFTNNATARAINGGVLSITSTTWSNTSTGIISSDASSFSTGGSWTNLGTINISNGSTANIGGTYSAATLATINFIGAGNLLNLSGTLDNTGNTLSFAGTNAAVTLVGASINNGTINWPAAPAVTIKSATLTDVTISPSSSITLPAGSTLSLAGAWTNQGSITAIAPPPTGTPATLNLGGTFTLASLGTLNTSAATLNLTGSFTMASAETLPLNATIGSWNLKGGTIHGGSISFAGPQLLHIQSGTLDGVHITGGDLNEDGASASLAILNGIIIDSKNFNITGNKANVAFDGASQSIDNLNLIGTATTAANQQMISLGGAKSTSGITVTLSASSTVQGNVLIRNNPFRINNVLINNGSILANSAGQTLAITPSTFTNNATAASSNGGTLNIAAATWTNSATGTISANASTVSFGNAWSNAGTINLTNASTLNLGGTFTTAQIGTINKSADSNVNITGTLDNTAAGNTTAMLHFNSITGSWNLASGGVIKNGTVFTTDAQQLNFTGGTLNAASLAPGSIASISNSTGTLLGTSTLAGSFSVNTSTLAVGVNSPLTVTTATNTGTMSLASATTIFASFSTLKNVGSLNIAGASSGGLNLTNTGTLTVSGTQNWTSAVFQNQAGTATFNDDIGSSSAIGTFNISGGNVVFNSTQHLTQLFLNSLGVATLSPPTTGQRSLLVVNNLTFGGSTNAWQGQLDLNQNDLIVHNGNAAGIYNQVKTGMNLAGGLYWAGKGIISSAAATDPADLSALAVLPNSMAGGLPVFTTFDGQAVSATDVIVKYTYYGDADLSGTVTGNDYTLIDNGFNLHSTGWQNGDFNYDGVVDGSDYSLIDNAFNRQGTSLATVPGSMVAATAAEISAVPEPTSIAVMLFGGLIMHRSKRRRMVGDLRRLRGF